MLAFQWWSICKKEKSPKFRLPKKTFKTLTTNSLVSTMQTYDLNILNYQFIFPSKTMAPSWFKMYSWNVIYHLMSLNTLHVSDHDAISILLYIYINHPNIVNTSVHLHVKFSEMGSKPKLWNILICTETTKFCTLN